MLKDNIQYSWFFRALLPVAVLSFLVLGGVQRVLTAGFGISPPRGVVTVAPGGETVISQTIKNDSTKTTHFRLQVMGVVRSATGGIVLVSGRDVAEAWIKTEKSDMSIGPGKEEKVQYVIAVPKRVLPGSHYVGLVAETVPEGGVNERAVGITTRLVTILTVQVSGVVEEKISLVNWQLNGVWWNSVRAVQLRLKNEGAIEVPIRIQLMGRDWFHHRQQFTIPFDRQVLVGEERDVLEVINVAGMKNTFIGPTALELVVSYGRTAQVIVSARTVWFVPGWLVGLVGAVVVLGGVFLWQRKRT